MRKNRGRNNRRLFLLPLAAAALILLCLIPYLRGEVDTGIRIPKLTLKVNEDATIFTAERSRRNIQHMEIVFTLPNREKAVYLNVVSSGSEEPTLILPDRVNYSILSNQFEYHYTIEQNNIQRILFRSGFVAEITFENIQIFLH